jgi:hypothetical protein
MLRRRYYFFHCSLLNTLCRMGTKRIPLHYSLLFSYTSWLRRTEDTIGGGSGQQAKRLTALAPSFFTAAHHEQSGHFSLCEEHPYLCHGWSALPALLWKVENKKTRKGSRSLFLCTFLITFLGKEEILRGVRSEIQWRGRLPLCGTADNAFFILYFILSYSYC